ncbi:GH17301 [Drosophila grimshawi]|uniref:GH17301 n=1 Tax=Drosophila grimshawi TaxID=7222 RepID=B4JSY4_DROGR|nr:GH17301 [Drosophila grimshawi]
MYLVVVMAFFWIAECAAAMMCPIVKAVLLPPHPSKISMVFYFGVAYAATIGGCATLIGTGTNLVFKGIYETQSLLNFIHSC